jgi:hypothetical protein
MPMPICRSVPGHCCRRESCHAVHVFHPKPQAGPASSATIIRLRRLYFMGAFSGRQLPERSGVRLRLETMRIAPVTRRRSEAYTESSLKSSDN